MIEGDKIHIDIAIPANTRATVYVPEDDISDITENGKPATAAAGVDFLSFEDKRAVFAIGSGRYQFVSKLRS